MSLKLNRETGNYEVQADGVYQNSETGDRFQMRKGQVVGEYDAKFLSKAGPWPGETDEGDVEARQTSGTKKAQAPENKSA